MPYEASCQKAVRYPKETIHSLEEHGIFAQGALTPESIERCKIHYLSAIEAKDAVMGFLRLIEQYEPKAVGGSFPMPDLSPKTMRLRKTITTIVATAIPLGGMATIRRYSQPTGADTFTSSTPYGHFCEWLVSGSFYQSVGATILGSLRHVDLIRLCDRDGRVIRPF